MRNMEVMKKALSILLAFCMVLSCVPTTAYAVTEDGLCEHHTEHTADCGYVGAVTGVPCAYECAECAAVATYSVTIAEGITNGTVTADKATAAEGATVTLTIAPNEGYALDALTVTYADDNTAVIVAEDNTFTMPAGDVTVTAVFKEKAAADESGSWYTYPCTHASMIYTDNLDGTHSGTCPDCGADTGKASHTPESGICTACGGAFWTITVVVDPDREYTCIVPAGQDATINGLYVEEGYVLDGVQVYYSGTYAPVTGFRCGYETITIPGEYVTADLTVGVSVRTVDIDAHRDHVYAGAPTFTWAEDHSAATATWVCLSDANTNTVDCTVTIQTQDATCAAEGKTTYTAAVTWNSTDYTDTRTVSIPADANNHTPDKTGKCTVCGYQYPFSTYDSYAEDVTTGFYADLDSALTVANGVSSITVLADYTIGETVEVTLGNSWLVLSEGVTLTNNGTLTFGSLNGFVADGGTYEGSGTVMIGESKGIIVNDTLYYHGGDVTSSGLELNEVTNATYYKAGDGYAIFTPASADTEAALELNDASITGPVSVESSSSVSQAINCGGNLTIRFSGTNTLIGGEANAESNGIVVSGDLTLSGINNESVLNTSGGKLNGTGSNCGIECDSLIVTGGTVNAGGGSGDGSPYGVFASTVEVREGATLNATGGTTAQGNSFGVYAQSVAVDGTLNAVGGASEEGFSADFSAGIDPVNITGAANGTVMQIVLDETAGTMTIAYSVVGNATLGADLICWNPYEDMDGMEEITFIVSFTVPTGTSLTIPAGITLDLTKADTIDIQGDLIVNGTLICPHVYDDSGTCTICGAVQTFTVTFDANGAAFNDGTTQMTVEIEYGTILDLSTYSEMVSKDGYYLDGWYKNDTWYPPNSQIGVTGDITLIAVWAENRYALYLDPNGGKINIYGQETTGPFATSFSLGANICDFVTRWETKFTREGYTFKGFTTVKDDASTLIDTSADYPMPGETLTLYALWEENMHTVTFVYGMGNLSQQTIGEVTPQALNPYTGDPKTGYTFAGWNTKSDGSGTAYADGQEITLTADIMLYPQWQVNNHKITWNLDGGQCSMELPASADFGTTFYVSGFSKDGCYLVGLTDQDGNMLSGSLAFGGIQYCVTMPDKDVTITAVWKEYLYVSFFDSLNRETQTVDWTPDLAAFDTTTGVHFNNNGLNSRDDQIAGDYAVQWYDASGSLLEAAPTDAGTYTIKVTLGETASEKYILTADTLTYTIAPLDLSTANVGLNWPNGQPRYNGQQQLPDAVGATVYYNSNYDPLPKESYSFAPVEGKNCMSAGQAYCLIVGDGKNVVGQVEKSYYINCLSLTLPDAAERVYAYDGTPKATDFSNETVPEGYAFVEPVYWYEAGSSTRLAEAPSDAGEYEVYVKYTPEDTVNYSTEYRREPYTIEARKLTADVQFDTSKVYDTGTGVTLTCTPTNAVEGDSILLTAMAVYDSPDAGTGKTITVTFQLSCTDAKNYSAPDSYTVTDAEITPREVTVHPEYPLARVWDGTDTVAMTKTGWSMTGHYPAVDNLQIDLSAATARVETSDAGQDKPVIFENVVITGNEKGNYTIVFEERTIDIQVLNLGSGSVTVAFTGDTPVYTGSTVYPENAVVTVQPSSQEAFVLDSSLWEFTPDTGMNNSNAGTAYAYISATGASSNVTGKKYIQYTIDKASLTGVTAENETITYDGQPHGISVTGIDSTMTVYYGTSKEDCASVEPITCTNVADSKTIWYKVVSRNYEDFYGSATVTIDPATITVTADPVSKTYGDANPELTCTVSGLVNADTMSGALIRAEGENVGEYAITQGTLTAGGNYTISFTGASLTINAKPITSSDVKLNGSLSYTGSEQTQAITVTEGITYEVSGNKATDVGTYELIVKGTGNYSGSVKLSWSIKETVAVVGTAPTAKDLTYTGEDQALVTAGTTADGTLVYSLTEDGEYTKEIPTGKSAVTYTVWYKVIGDDNHSDSEPVSISVTIKKAAADYEDPTANTLTYNSSAQALVTEGTTADGTMMYKLGENGTYSATVPTAKDADIYTVYYYVKGDSNHNDSAEQKIDVTIGQLDITGKTVDITLADTLTYNGAEQTMGVSSVKLGNLTVTYTVSDNTGTNATDYTLTITGSGNFKGRATKTWSIAKKSVTVSAKNQTITCGETISGTEITSTGLVDGHSVTVTLTPSTANVTANGTITASAAVITADGSDVTANYSVSYASGKLVIEPDISQIDKLTTENVTSANEEDIKAVQAMMASAETGGIDEATAAQWAAITANCEDLIEKIEAVEAENARIADAAADFDLNTVKSTDEAAITALISDIDDLLETQNLTEDERTALETILEQVERMINTINETAEDSKAATDTIDALEAGSVTSDDKDELEQAIATIDELLQADHLTEEERTALEDAKADAEALIDVIEAVQDAADTENTEKVEDVTAENVKPEDKEALEDAKADLEKALEDNSGNYTEEEKQTIQDEIQRIEDAIEALKNVEDVTETITQLPETVEPDDEEATEKILDAKKAYDELTDRGKSLVDEATKEKLDSLVAALTAYEIIKGDGGKWTKGSSYGLSFTANGPFSKFVGIEVDGKEVASTYYTAESGSTIITLKQSFLKRLSTGEHTITVLYTDGETSGTFKILAQSTSPATGDDSNIMLWSGILCVSTLGLVVLLADRKRRRSTK